MKNEVKEEVFIPKTKHKTLKILLAVLIIGVLALGGYFLYQDKFNNPNKTVISILDDGIKEFNKSFDKKGNEKFKLNGLISVEANLPKEYQEIANLFKNLELQFSGDVDTKDSLANITLNTKYKKEQLIDIKAYYENNVMYVLLDGLYDKYLKVSLESNKKTLVKNEFNIDTKDIKVLANSLSKASKSAFEKLNFTRTNETITINGKEQNVYNNYVVLDGTKVKALLKDIYTALSKDNEFIPVFKKLTGHEFSLESMTKDLDKDEIKGTYKLNFYTTKDLLNSKLVSERIEVTEDNITSTFNADKISDDEIMVSINSNGMVMSSTIKKNDSVFNIDLSINAMGASIKLDLKTNFEKIKEFTKPDVSNSKNFEDLTQQETNAIAEKLQKNKGLLEFIQDISKLSTLKG